MYYEEKTFSGILHYRTTPDGEWVAYTQKELTTLLLTARQQIVDILAEKGGEGDDGR